MQRQRQLGHFIRWYSCAHKKSPNEFFRPRHFLRVKAIFIVAYVHHPPSCDSVAWWLGVAERMSSYSLLMETGRHKRSQHIRYRVSWTAPQRYKTEAETISHQNARCAIEVEIKCHAQVASVSARSTMEQKISGVHWSQLAAGTSSKKIKLKKWKNDMKIPIDFWALSF